MNEKISISMHIMNYYLVIYYYNSTSGFKLNIVYKYTKYKITIFKDIKVSLKPFKNIITYYKRII